MTPQLKILIVEDEAIIAEDIRIILEDLSYTVSGIAYSFNEAIEQLDNNHFDLVITDIILTSEKDGVDLAKLLKEFYKIPFIYITSHADKATVNRATQYNPIGYVIKPFQPEDIFITLKLAMNQLELKTDAFSTQQSQINGTTESMFVKDGNQLLKVEFNDLLWLKAEGNYVELRTKSKRVVLRSTMKEIGDKLPINQFIRVHKSYAINVKHISSIQATEVLIGTEAIPIGRMYREQLLGTINLV